MKQLFSTQPIASHSLLALLPRLILAIVFFMHGSQKMLGWYGGFGLEATTQFMSEGLGIPLFLAYLAVFAEFFGAIFLFFGFLTRLSALSLAVTMAVAVLAVHGDAFLLEDNGMEYALTLFVVSVISFMAGPGKLSIDALLFNRRN